MPSIPAPHEYAVDSGDPAFPPKGAADTELEFFFTMADSAMGNRSNYAVMIGEEEDTIEDRAEVAHAQRLIKRLLLRMSDFDAGVLKAAYEARPWPLALREELGRVTGVVVRLACVEVGLPDDDAELAALEHRTAARLDEALARLGSRGLTRFRPKGLTLLRRAFESYERERGGPNRPVPAGVS